LAGAGADPDVDPATMAFPLYKPQPPIPPPEKGLVANGVCVSKRLCHNKIKSNKREVGEVVVRFAARSSLALQIENLGLFLRRKELRVTTGGY